MKTGYIVNKTSIKLVRLMEKVENVASRAPHVGAVIVATTRIVPSGGFTIDQNRLLAGRMCLYCT